ncbi:leucine-rich repeat domain-containing protein, partial [Pseudoflavonifractor phocaeensis]|uniref:leucine-rich repeat domain-containing protein n=1 Tax=Pseudoflavonifractor phocaeensis TaxID=1870988 RepID=UPI00195E1428
VWDGGDPFIVIGGELVCYFGDDPVVTVPDGVRGIATGAFSLARTENCKVTSVTLPDSVEYIADGAFGAQSELTTVTFGSGLKEIGFGAFDGCASLNNVVLPEGLKKIGDNAFAGCSSLDSISFPSTLETLYPGSLRDTPYWENLPGGENYLGGVFFFKETELDSWTPLHVDVRPGTLGIMEWQSSRYDTTMSLPDGLRYIGPDAFPYGMYELDDFTLPESVTYIDDVSDGHQGVPPSALRDLPDALTYIGMNAFYSDYQIDISYLEIPNGVKYIGERAFYAINQGTKMNIRLPDSLEHMGWRAFAANNIGQVTNWPAAITTWDDFLAVCQMDALTLPDTILNVRNIESSDVPTINLNRVKQIGSDNVGGGSISCRGDTLLLMPNVEKFTATYINGDNITIALSDKVATLPDYVEVYGDFPVVPFEPSMLEGLPSAPPSAAPMVGSFTDVRTNNWFAGAVE